MGKQRVYLGVDIGLRAQVIEALERLGFVWVDSQEALTEAAPAWLRLVPKRRPYWEEGVEEGPFFWRHPSGVTVGLMLWAPEQALEMTEADVSVSEPDGWRVLLAQGGEEQPEGVRVVGHGEGVGEALGEVLSQLGPRHEGWSLRPLQRQEGAALEAYRLNQDWMEKHAGEHVGEWVALHQGELIAHSVKYREVRDQVERRGLLDHALFREI
jgi:hypothetical protein